MPDIDRYAAKYSPAGHLATDAGARLRDGAAGIARLIRASAPANIHRAIP